MKDKGPYEIIGKLPLFRRRFGFHRNADNAFKLAFGFYMWRVDGFAVGLRATATSRGEALKIASEMLSSGRYDSVVMQNLQEPEEALEIVLGLRESEKGALELSEV